MANISKSGSKSKVYTSVRGTLVATGALTANTWFEILTVGGSTALPLSEITAVFKSPDTSATAITLATGDSVYPLTLTQLCKTDAEVSFEEGVIDVTDDCEDGFNASILDGYKGISGSFNGFSKFDDSTGELTTNTTDLFGRFINVVTDDGEGVYTETKVANESLIAFILMNDDAITTNTLNYLIVPIILTGFGSGAGLKDAQKRDLTWEKAQGYPSLYKRVAFTADL